MQINMRQVGVLPPEENLVREARGENIRIVQVSPRNSYQIMIVAELGNSMEVDVARIEENGNLSHIATYYVERQRDGNEVWDIRPICSGCESSGITLYANWVEYVEGTFDYMQGVTEDTHDCDQGDIDRVYCSECDEDFNFNFIRYTNDAVRAIEMADLFSDSE